LLAVWDAEKKNYMGARWSADLTQVEQCLRARFPGRTPNHARTAPGEKQHPEVLGASQTGVSLGMERLLVLEGYIVGAVGLSARMILEHYQEQIDAPQ
jgi:hypothetical protein